MRVQTVLEEVGAQFTNASLVLGSGLVFAAGFETAYSLNPFDPGCDLLQEELAQRMVRRSLGDSVDFQFSSAPTVVGSIDATVFPLCTTHPYNYFHFLIEALPELLCFLKNGVIDQETLIVTGQLHPNMRDALVVVMGERPLPLLQLNLMQQVDCRVVHAGPGAVFGAERMDGSLSAFSFRESLLRALREHFRFLWAAPAEAVAPNIMVARRSHARHLVNAGQLEAAAIRAGYVVVRPETMPLVQQIRLFSGASHIIGPTGAWLANLGFVRESARVTVLLPETCASDAPLWQGLGKIFGMTVTEVYCPVAQRNERQPIHSDFHCPLDRFLALL